MIPGGVLPKCGRGDCDADAVVIRAWRSESGRRWQTTACLEHDDGIGVAVPPMPGFVLTAEVRVNPSPTPPPATSCEACPGPGCRPADRARRGACTLPAVHP
jgi:hypothetical protein